VSEIKRIAQAVIHFEPALEMLVPDCRRRTQFAKSNWLHANCLAADNKSRSQSVAYIEEQLNLRQVVDAIQRPHDRDFCWNFQNLLLSEKRTIEFRKPPASTTAEEALSWAEFAMSFVQSSIKCESAAKLQNIPPNLRGLDWFLRQSKVAGANEHRRLRKIWKGKGLDDFLEPSYMQELDPTSQRARNLEQRLAKDKTEIGRLLKAREPYW
jgi:transposase InsO family protein